MKIVGIDVHKKELMVVVIDASRPEEKPTGRRFVTMPSELQRFRIWLQQQGVEEAVMESTAQYWRSVWLELEPHMRLPLAQAFSNRAPRGASMTSKMLSGWYGGLSPMSSYGVLCPTENSVIGAA